MQSSKKWTAKLPLDWNQSEGFVVARRNDNVI